MAVMKYFNQATNAWEAIMRGPRGLQGNDGRGFIYGNGFPEGVVAAPVGTTYVDNLATNGAVKWLKTSGNGNTGWVVEFGNTGRRDITSLLPSTLPNTQTGWPALMWRDNNRVTILANSNITVSSVIDVMVLPVGYRQPASIWVGGSLAPVGGALPVNGLVWLENNTVRLQAQTTGMHRRWALSWDTFDPWPTGNLLGVPATI